MNWKKFAIVAMVAFMAAACSRVPAGNVGVKVYKYGGSKGVDTETLSPGHYWIGWNEELHLFPTFTQTACWTASNDPQCGSATDESMTFQTVEGMSVSADIGITYSVDPDKAHILFQRYRKGIGEITDSYLRNIVRDMLVSEASGKSVEEVYGRGKVEIMTNVEKTVRDIAKPYGILIENLYWIGEIRLPKAVRDSLNAKIAATQMAQQRQNEVAQAKAEADKLIEAARGTAESILVNAKAQAEANRILAASITPQFNQYKALEKWDGMLPRLTGGDPLPFIDVTKEAETKKK